MTTKVHIVEEVPGVEEYRYFVSCCETPRDDPVRAHFDGKITAGHCDTLKEAVAWCDARGLSYDVERFEF